MSKKEEESKRENRIIELEKLVKELQEAISERDAKIEEMNGIIIELQAQLNTNSTNSSNPPSQDGPKKSDIKSLRVPSGKKPGAQWGHSAGGRKIILREPDCIEEHNPEKCEECPNASKCLAERHVSGRRQEIDMEIKTVITEHRTIQVTCPMNGGTYTGDFPVYITGTVQYGINLKTLAVALNTMGAMSIKRVHELLGDVFDIPISTGTISNMVKESAVAVMPTVNEIKEAIKEAGLTHHDETGINVNGKNIWTHVSSTKDLTHLSVQESRGKIGMIAAGIVQYLKGIAVHDCWAAYFSFLFISALCCAHVLRDLLGVYENYKQEWAKQMMDLLKAMKREKEMLILAGKTKAPDKIWEVFSKQYDNIVNVALATNPLPPPIEGKRLKRGKPRNIAERLEKRKTEYLMFFTNFDVPFDNNQAERDFRMFKVKQKVSGCFRTKKGAEDYAAVMSYLGTARKREMSLFTTLRDALSGNPFSVNA